MHITQAGLSALVRELESQLGFKLFERTTRRVTLTDAGQRFLPTAHDIQQSIAVSVRDIAGTVAGQRRNLRIAASPVMVNGILPYALKQHLSRHPDDVVELLDVSRNEVLPEVEQGRADMGLGIFFRPVSGIRLVRLFSSSLILISPRGWTPAGAGEEAGGIHISAVPASALIRLPQDNPFQQWVDYRLLGLNSAASPVSGCMRLRNIESCVAMVEIGSGHFIAPDFVRPVCRRYNIRARPILPEHVAVEFYALARAGTETAAVEKDFIDSFLRALIARRVGRKHAHGLS